MIPISCGGGGIPVIEDSEGNIKGIDSVIDKDLCAEVLADLLEVDKFMILTDVEGVFLDYKKPTQRMIPEMHLKEAEEYMAKGQFGSGSMAPKMLAAIRFV